MKRSAISFSLLQLIGVIIAFILGIYILTKFISLLNYEGRLSCKIGTAIANVFLSPFSDEEKAAMFLKYSTLAGTSALFAYEGWKAGKITYKIYEFAKWNPHIVGEWTVQRTIRTFATNTFKSLKEDVFKAIKGIISSAGEISTGTKLKLVGGSLATVGTILVGKRYLSQINEALSAISSVLGRIAISATELCSAEPYPIAIDYLQLDCNKFDKYLKEQLTKEAYEKLKKLVKDNRIEKCSPTSADWKELFLDIELAKVGKMTYEEGLRETDLSIPTLHYVFLLEKISTLGKDWKFGEAEMV